MGAVVSPLAANVLPMTAQKRLAESSASSLAFGELG